MATTVPLSWWFRHAFTCEVDCKLRSLCAYMGKLSILIQTLPSFHALTRLPAGVFSCLGCWMPVCHIGVSWHGDTLNHPCDFRIFHEMNHQKNYPAIGVLSTYGNSIYQKYQKMTWLLNHGMSSAKSLSPTWRLLRQTSVHRSQLNIF